MSCRSICSSADCITFIICNLSFAMTVAAAARIACWSGAAALGCPAAAAAGRAAGAVVPLLAPMSTATAPAACAADVQLLHLLCELHWWPGHRHTHVWPHVHRPVAHGCCNCRIHAWVWGHGRVVIAVHVGHHHAVRWHGTIRCHWHKRWMCHVCWSCLLLDVILHGVVLLLPALLGAAGGAGTALWLLCFACSCWAPVCCRMPVW